MVFASITPVILSDTTTVWFGHWNALQPGVAFQTFCTGLLSSYLEICAPLQTLCLDQCTGIAVIAFIYSFFSCFAMWLSTEAQEWLGTNSADCCCSQPCWPWPHLFLPQVISIHASQTHNKKWQTTTKTAYFPVLYKHRKWVWIGPA